MTPQLEGLSEAGVEWNRFLRCFRFARTDDLEHDGSRNVDFTSLEVDIVPFKTEQFAHPQPCPESQEHKSALPDAENSNESLNFACAEYRRSCFSLCTLSYQLNWIAIADLMSDSVIEDYAHKIPYFGAA